jgi:hypothetical protein
MSSAGCAIRMFDAVIGTFPPRLIAIKSCPPMPSPVVVVLELRPALDALCKAGTD